jgi:hypothetical protein
MTSRRIYLLMFVTVSWFFLNGFNSSVNNELLNRETQKTEAKPQTASQKLLESGQIQDKISSVNTSLQRIKPATVDGPYIEAAKNVEFEKHLDLSLPFKTTENNSLKVEKKAASQSGESNIFASETKKKSRNFEVDGDFLMTPNPEAEKIKSVDGAGIVIKVKP